MEYKLLGTSGLILIILLLALLKDGENMNPPLKRCVVIDANGIDITEIAEVCKQKLRETVN